MTLSTVPSPDGAESPHAPPEELSEAALVLWREVVTEYELGPHELALLEHAVRVQTTCSDLDALVQAEGAMLEGRVHPALVELRLQRVLLSRLIASLRIPVEEDGAGAPRLQRRSGARGPYGPRAVS